MSGSIPAPRGTEQAFQPLTNDDLRTLRLLIVAGRPVPADLANRLLADRDLWVSRAWEERSR